ncbi:hypothetical protein HS088_TW01G00749 [Tripterygium wilfordii]|uniref:Uncharacterized protein n=1 Tax=Tripterygium wilfordii TaxID=458696 RepID=A0A7J7E2S2_TRIWF|nr:hypothetical protein HS088_TW01G00749 [Tripterygium wilfordii]
MDKKLNTSALVMDTITELTASNATANRSSCKRQRVLTNKPNPSIAIASITAIYLKKHKRTRNNLESNQSNEVLRIPGNVVLQGIGEERRLIDWGFFSKGKKRKRLFVRIRLQLDNKVVCLLLSMLPNLSPL